MKYEEFLESKIKEHVSSGFDVELEDLNSNLKEWQKYVIRWSLRKGKSAQFLFTGAGKTFMQLEWAKQVHCRKFKPVLLLAPLAVSEQTLKESKKFNIGCEVKIVSDPSQLINGVNITNYEKLHKFDCSIFEGVVLDESSILKSFEGKFRNTIIENFKDTPYKLAATATPSPNDYMELGNHAEFLDVCSRTEMMSMYFVNDTSNTSNWRLKGHAKNNFWRWVSSWGVMIQHPQDLGFEEEGYDLPELKIETIKVPWDSKQCITLTDQRKVRKESIEARLQKLKEVVGDSEDPWLVWVDRNDESTTIHKNTEFEEVTGSMKPEIKTKKLMGFSDGEITKFVSKPKLSGFGLNWQHCNKMVFFGISHSFEAFYQAVRRCYRFGQTKPVTVYIILTDKEDSILESILRKQEQFEDMCSEMVSNMKDRIKEDIFDEEPVKRSYEPTHEFVLGF